jgi:hypothetical protein
MAEVAKFTQVDTSPSYFIDFLTYLDSQPDVRKMRAGVATQMNLAPGDKVLDLGCGIGGSAFALAEFTGPTGLVAGVEEWFAEQASLHASGDFFHCWMFVLASGTV